MAVRRKTGRMAALAAVTAAALLSACGSTKPTTTPKPTPPPDVTAAPVLVAQTSAGTVSYRSVGTGPPILMLMGFGGSIDAWAPAFIDDLARTHRVVMMDNAGIGHTVAVPAPLTVGAMAGQAAALIRTLKLGSPTVLGWSMGSFIAQSLAVDDPALVSKLVLCASLPGDGHASLPIASVGQQLRSSITDPTLILGLLYPADQRAAGFAYGAGIEAYPGFYLPPPTVDDEQLSVLVTWTSGAEQAGHHTSTLKVPTLVMDGEEDVLTPVANSHYLATTIPGARLALYPDAGHAFLFQDADVVAARIDTL